MLLKLSKVKQGQGIRRAGLGQFAVLPAWSEKPHGEGAKDVSSPSWDLGEDAE